MGSGAENPVQRLVATSLLLGGRPYHQVNAYLADRLRGGEPAKSVFGLADGTGTDPSRMVAAHKAISEALERWAWGHHLEHSPPEAYGFDLDSSTTGIAAYPGLFDWQSRKQAWQEAVERYCVNAWWSGLAGNTVLRREYPDTDAIRIENPASRHAVVLAWRRSTGGILAFGSAAAGSEATAHHRAWIEMERSMGALEHFLAKNPGFSVQDLTSIQHPVERSIMERALPSGQSGFFKRLDTRVTGKAAQPRIAVDCPLPGPWRKYATVWRVLLVPQD